MLEVAHSALPLGLTLLALALGYALGLGRGRAELRAYKQGLCDEHDRTMRAKREPSSGGSCWVKSQVEARPIEPPSGG